MKLKRHIAQITATIVLLLTTLTAGAQTYTPTDEGSHIEFKVDDHMIAKHTVTGTFEGLKGKIVFDPAQPGRSSFDVSVSAATIHTGIGMRDKDLKKDKYFNADKFPLLQFRSTKVEKTGSGYVLHGNMIIKGISKAVSIPFTATPANGGYLFKGNCVLNRMDYKVGDPGKIEDKITVQLQVFAHK